MDPFGFDPDRPQFNLSLSLSDALALTDALRVLAAVREGHTEAITTYIVCAEAGPTADQADELADRIDALTAAARKELVDRINEAVERRRREYDSED